MTSIAQTCLSAATGIMWASACVALDSVTLFLALPVAALVMGWE